MSRPEGKAGHGNPALALLTDVRKAAADLLDQLAHEGETE